MRVGIAGRTHILLETARRVRDAGHEIAFVFTARESSDATAGVRAFESFAREIDAPFHAGSIPDHPEQRYAAEVCLSMNWPTLIPKSFLDAFPHGVLNAHAGDLPRYRGNATPNWAILNGETQACLTIHRMVPELDAGPIAKKSFTEISDTTDVGDLYRWLEQTIPADFVDVVEQIDAGTARFAPQDPSVQPLRAFPRRPEDSRIDWSLPREGVLRLIRASTTPFAGAFTTLEGQQKVTILAARPFEPGYDYLAAPGQVCVVHDGNPVIACGDGMLEVLRFDDDEPTRRAVLSSLRNRLI